jgi:SAM-dependent methyltransferase
MRARARTKVSSVAPKVVRRLRSAALGADLERRMEALETRLLESQEESWERSRARWREAKPTKHLTWSLDVDGEAFVAKAAEYGAFGTGRRVLEVGPGYGRLLAACLAAGVSFESYVGVDLSRENVDHLRNRFPQDAISFVEADVERIEIGEPADSIISSLTFKHLFPSFEGALRNLAPQLRPEGLVIFDLVEGHRRYFEADGVTYLRWYSRAEVGLILAATGLQLVAFDEVLHMPRYARLLVVARKPA